MRRSRVIWISLALLSVLSGITLFVPLAACPTCSGAGTLTVMGSHPDAMGSATSPSGKLIEIGCSTCDGKARMSLSQRLMR